MVLSIRSIEGEAACQRRTADYQELATGVSGGLGRRRPTDDKHLRRYSLTAETMPTKPTPVCIGVNWYSGFDDPIERAHGSHWLPDPSQWGRIRGGHEICLMPPRLPDTDAWYRCYDQGREGSCVGYALSRMMSLLNRQQYDARWLYHQAQLADEFTDTPPEEGTTGRAGCDVLRTTGHCRVRAHRSLPPDPDCGISTNRWAASVQQIAECLDPASFGSRVLDAGYVVFLNSWGTGYPHYTRMALEALARLVFAEDGDAVLVTDR